MVANTDISRTLCTKMQQGPPVPVQHHLQSDGHYARSSKCTQPEAIDSQLALLSSERTPTKVAKGLTALSRKCRVGRLAK